MNSVRDHLAVGLPHSEIRGSTIARISPRLIAACHVLHRLLVPRHPPNALLRLISHYCPAPTLGGRREAETRAQRRDRQAGRDATHDFSSKHADRPGGAPHDAEPCRRSDIPSSLFIQRAAAPCGASATRAPPSPWTTTNAISWTLPPIRAVAPRAGSRRRPIDCWWRRSDSNRRPPACKAGALPLSYAPEGPPARRPAPESGGPGKI